MSRDFNRALVLCALLAAVGCSDATSVQPPPPDPHPAAQAARVVDDFPDEAEFRQIAAEIPEFGGYYLDEAGNLQTLVTDLSRAERVQQRLAPVLRRFQAERGGARFSRAGEAAPRVGVRRAAFTFLQLAAWRNAVLSALGSTRGVVFIDLDEAVNRVTVGIESGSVRPRVEARLRALSLPRGAVGFVQADPIEALSGPTAARRELGAFTPVTLQNRVRPLLGGLRIGRMGHGCTLGLVVLAGGQPGALTNSHCSDIEWQTESTAFYQPSYNGGAADGIGTEAYDPPGWLCNTILVDAYCRRSDASFMRLTSGVTAQVGIIARTTDVTSDSPSGSITIDPAGPSYQVVGEAAAAAGQWVEKVGSTTGWTRGPVTRTCASFSYYTHPRLCQTFVYMDGDDGDSGSPVFAFAGVPRTANSVNLFGLIFARSGITMVYSPIRGIRADLEPGIGAFQTSYGSPPAPTYTVSINGPVAPTAYSWSTWSATGTNGTSPYTYTWSRDGVEVGTGATYSDDAGSDAFELSVTATDSQGRFAAWSIWVTPTESAPSGCPPPAITCE